MRCNRCGSRDVITTQAGARIEYHCTACNHRWSRDALRRWSRSAADTESSDWLKAMAR